MNTMNRETILQTGVKAAYQGAEALRSWFGRIDRIEKKGEIDLVTEADRAAEKVIIQEIRQRFPDHAILSEECGALDGNSGGRWIVDPLDGTTNFAHGLPIFGVSIAFEHDNELQAGVVLNPITAEIFTAVKGGGARRNGEKITVSDTRKLSESLLATGFPYNVRQVIDPIMERLTRGLKASRGVRRLGAAALDLCYVACGRFDGFWEQNLKPWDTAAGVLIAREAGARATDFSHGTFTVDKPEILVTNGYIHDELTTLLTMKESE